MKTSLTHTMKYLVFLLAILVLQGSKPIINKASNDICLNPEEAKLYQLLMQYRKSKGLESIALSAKLTKVAQAHAKDLDQNYAYDSGSDCNPHSWSEKGDWTYCCYTNDHKQAKCMWDKPKEIAGYDGAGYEIAYYSSKGATAEEGLAGWQKSAGHNPVMINEGIWKKAKWNAVGIGFYGEYGVVWFGELPDETTVSSCAAN